MPQITRLRARPVMVPVPLPAITASGTFDRAALVLLDMESSTGLVGRCYLFAFTEAMLKPTVACVEAVAPLLEGSDIEPDQLDRELRKRFRLIDTHGILGQVLAGINMAAWDLAAQIREQPLARMLGADVDTISAYNSCGLWLADPATLAEQAASLLASGGFDALKIRLGRENPGDDVAAIRAVKSVLGAQQQLMSDYNQALAADEAVARVSTVDNEGLYWIEEPVRFDDFGACADVRTAASTPIQIGENLRSPLEMTHAVRANAAQYYMPDPQRIGGVSGWMEAAGYAAQRDIPLSSHLFPEICVHLLAASSTRHWLEYVDWANAILQEPLEISNGRAVVPTRPGSGMVWDEAAVKRYTA